MEQDENRLKMVVEDPWCGRLRSFWFISAWLLIFEWHAFVV